jgi:hypothetical protein
MFSEKNLFILIISSVIYTSNSLPLYAGYTLVPENRLYDNQTLLGGCPGTVYGCCHDNVTACASKECTNCNQTLLGGCPGTVYGCCHDNVTACASKECTNCNYSIS